MKKWKELFAKNYKVVQVCGCICLIGALGAGVYSLQGESVAAKEAEVVEKTDTEEENTTVKEEKDKTDSSKKKEIKTVKTETEKLEKEAEKKTVKKEAASVQQISVEKKEEKKADPKQIKEPKPQENPVSAPDQSSQSEQEPEDNPTPAPQQTSQPEQQPQENPAPAPEQPQQPQKPEHVHNWVYHEEQGHENTYTVTEEVYEPWECCNVCGADCTADPGGHMYEHAINYEGGGYHTEYFKTKEVTKTEWIVDVPAYTECSGCGARQ